MSTAGERAGTGAYACSNCGVEVRIENDYDTLPSCPYCFGQQYTRTGGD